MTAKSNDNKISKAPEELSQFNWKPYPKQKPSDNQRYDDFLVLCQNPRFLKKKLGYEKYYETPQFLPTIASWLGDGFSMSTPVLFYTEITFPEMNNMTPEEEKYLRRLGFDPVSKTNGN